ncbi:unnamed protein product, partial [Didymodactylos carnosus]
MQLHVRSLAQQEPSTSLSTSC